MKRQGRSQGERSRARCPTRPSEGGNPVHASILHFWPPEHETVAVCCLSSYRISLRQPEQTRRPPLFQTESPRVKGTRGGDTSIALCSEVSRSDHQGLSAPPSHQTPFPGLAPPSVSPLFSWPLGVHSSRSCCWRSSSPWSPSLTRHQLGQSWMSHCLSLWPPLTL